MAQGGDSVISYFNKINRCWDEMGRLMPLPTCVCGKCTCNLNKKVANLDDTVKLMQFLMGLTSTYDVTSTQILNSSPLPSLNKAYAMVISEEAQRHVNLSYNSGEGSSAMLAKAFQGKDWFKDMKEKKGTMQKRPGANQTNEGVADTPVTQEAKSSSKGDLANMVSYVMKEVQRLNKGKDQKSKKILAKGAAIGKLYYLNICNLNVVSSVSLEKHDCNVNFSILVNASSKNQCNLGAYDSIPIVKCNSIKESENKVMNDLRYQRLGHASLNVLQRINGISTLDLTKSVCETCHNVKQARLPFALSDTRLDDEDSSNNELPLSPTPAINNDILPAANHNIVPVDTHQHVETRIN
ncbi:uncharacterized protein G2W53_022214 [Senna tora]|uniref:GAG-pre-integrase domain-containing protein n=1 Tax=Senna tora TaxID=362788 RepID=A0A834TLJ9_9FABA|nr:uncharacterized protein G2W53_022214 [Senna tora]